MANIVWGDLIRLSPSALVLGNSAAALLDSSIVPADKHAQIVSCQYHNLTTNSVANVYLLFPTSATNNERYNDEYSSRASREYFNKGPYTIEPGENLYGYASTANAITVHIVGRVEQ